MVLFNDSIYYNIAYGNLSATREQVEAAAAAAKVGAVSTVLVVFCIALQHHLYSRYAAVLSLSE
jgi:ABC-type multidrug transport system fused ATPase/permease subunit